jgi:hypothetical protein
MPIEKYFLSRIAIRDRLDALLASARVTESHRHVLPNTVGGGKDSAVRPHPVSSCSELLLLFTPELPRQKRILGVSINNSTEFLANLQNSQSQISNLQLELDILRRRHARMRLSEPSSSPRGASSSPAFSEISSISDTDVVSVEYDDTDESSASGTVATAISSSPSEVPALAPALGSFDSLGPVVDLSGEVTASADLFDGDFGVTGFSDDYGNPFLFYI